MSKRKADAYYVAEDSWFYGQSTSKDDGDVKRTISFKRDRLHSLSLGDLKVFNRQRDALEAMKQSGSCNTRVFSFERDDTKDGERRYMCTTLKRFWDFYSTKSSRHLYELIAENMPCRLYFDLEYSKSSNKDVDHQVVYDFFVNTLIAVIGEVLSLEITASNLLVLDSSTDVKFSSHIVVHLPDGKLFPSNVAMRPFINVLSSRLRNSPPYQLWNADRTKEVLLCDTCVYTSNRNFRLFLSSKMSKTAVLQLNDLSFYGGIRPSDERIFYDSLCVPVDYKNYPVLELSIEEVATTRHLPSEGATYPTSACSGPSPFACLDDFMMLLFRKWNVNSYIRQWSITNDEQGKPITITYYPANCRYCFNIGREHKSNGVYWVVDLKRCYHGYEKITVDCAMEFWQRCFDAECNGLSSNKFPLPQSLASSCQLEQPVSDDSFTAPVESTKENVFDTNVIREYFSQWKDVFDE